MLSKPTPPVQSSLMRCAIMGRMCVGNRVPGLLADEAQIRGNRLPRFPLKGRVDVQSAAAGA